MAISDVLIIAAPAAMGISLVAPKKYSPTLAVLLASIGTVCRIFSLYMTRQGQLEAALVADNASIMFDLLSIVKALELI